MGEADESSVIEELVIEASPATVFGFFTDPTLMSRWMGSGVDLEAVPGGVFAVDIGGNLARGEFLEVIPFERIVFSWGWIGSSAVPPGSSVVTFTFQPGERGHTLLRMVHEGLSVEEGTRHRHGWIHYLARLRIAAPGGDPGLDPHAADPSMPLHER